MSDSGSRKTVILLQPKLGYMDSLRSAPSLPLGLLHAASLAAGSFRVVIFDQRTTSDWKRELAEAVSRNNPFAIGATMYMGPPAANALDMLDFAAKISSAHRFVGGVLPSLIPETCIADRGGRINSVVQGEGERTLQLLLERLADGKSPEGVDGVWFRDGDEIRCAATPPLLDFETLPEIPYHLIEIKRYLPQYERRGTFYMETSRGCPMNCGYCYNPAFNRGAWRAQSPEKIRERLEFAKREFGVNHIYFVDDNFFVDKDRGLRIAGHMMDLDISWQIQGMDISSLKKMSSEDLAFLKRSGLMRITVGIESGSERVRRFLGKKFRNEDVYEITERMKEFGFVVFCSFMCNIPTETVSEVGESVDMALRITKMNPHFRVSPFYRYVPSPGTGIFETAVAHGYEQPKGIEEWGYVSFDWNGSEKKTGARDSLLGKIHMATLFCDSKSKEYSLSLPFRAIAAIYKPVARLRLKHMFFSFMPESKVFFRFLRRASMGDG